MIYSSGFILGSFGNWNFYSPEINKNDFCVKKPYHYALKHNGILALMLL